MPRRRRCFPCLSYKSSAVSCQARHVAADFAKFAAIFYALHQKSPLARFVAASFRKRSRSDYLLTCNRVRDENLSLPTLCGQICYLYPYKRKNHRQGGFSVSFLRKLRTRVRIRAASSALLFIVQCVQETFPFASQVIVSDFVWVWMVMPKSVRSIVRVP